MIGYHNKEIVLRADKTVSTGGPTFLLDLGISDPFLANLAHELQATKPMLHPDILSGATNDQEREILKGFLIGLVGVQKMDAKAVCLEAILPKIATMAAKPALDELLTLTKYCQKHLPPASVQGKELWVVNKRTQIRDPSEVYFSAEFKPANNWEEHQRYLPGADFLSADYVSGCSDPSGWREFFRATGVKEAPDNGVEDFAMKFAEDRLRSRFKSIVTVEKRNFGYAMEAEEADGQRAHLEVKGLSAEGNVELTGNEAEAARVHGQSFYLCVVAGIPNSPALHLVRDPDRKGVKDKLTIRAADWKRERFPDPGLIAPVHVSTSLWPVHLRLSRKSLA